MEVSEQDERARSTVREEWAKVEANAAHDFPLLTPLISLARHHPILGGLFPFLSLGRLCFSLCCSYPYLTHVFIIALGPSLYSAQRASKSHGLVEGVELGRGNARDAIACLESVLPKSYGPAVLGDADSVVQKYVF